MVRKRRRILAVVVFCAKFSFVSLCDLVADQKIGRKVERKVRGNMFSGSQSGLQVVLCHSGEYDVDLVDGAFFVGSFS